MFCREVTANNDKEKPTNSSPLKIKLNLISRGNSFRLSQSTSRVKYVCSLSTNEQACHCNHRTLCRSESEKSESKPKLFLQY